MVIMHVWYVGHLGKIADTIYVRPLFLLLEFLCRFWEQVLWHLWIGRARYPGPSGSPWAENPAEGAGNLLECALGSHTSGLLAEWQLRVVCGAEGAAGCVAAEPDVWTAGSMVQDKVSGASSSGSFFFLISLVNFGLIGGGAILMMMLVKTRQWVLRGCCSVLGPLQTVQRAEFRGVILYFGHIGRLLDGNVGSRPAAIVNDGDIVLLVGGILEMRGRDTVRITKIKGHADEAMVRMVGMVGS